MPRSCSTRPPDGRSSLEGFAPARLDLPHAVLLDDVAVEQDLSARAQVLDDVPVDLALVRAADVREAVPKRQVDRAVDLLVEQRVLHEARDARVAADAELAEPARALVPVQHSE